MPRNQRKLLWWALSTIAKGELRDGRESIGRRASTTSTYFEGKAEKNTSPTGGNSSTPFLMSSPGSRVLWYDTTWPCLRPLLTLPLGRRSELPGWKIDKPIHRVPHFFHLEEPSHPCNPHTTHYAWTSPFPSKLALIQCWLG